MTNPAVWEAASCCVLLPKDAGRHGTFFRSFLAVLLRIAISAALISAGSAGAWAQSGSGGPILTAATARLEARAPRHTAVNGVINLSGDYGGYIAEYMREVDWARASRVRVEITGECRSACTLFLGAGNVCVSRSATLRFHGPSRSGQPLAREHFEAFSQRMAGYYPEPIRSWFLTRARYSLARPIALSGAELIRLGIPEC